jgi:hypothetical protein
MAGVIKHPTCLRATSCRAPSVVATFVERIVHGTCGAVPELLSPTRRRSMPLPDEPTKPQPRTGPKRRDPLRDPPPQPLQDPPDQPLHDPEGDPTREPQQPFGDPTPSPASNPPSVARAILIFNSRQQSRASERIRHDRFPMRVFKWP